MDKILSLLRQYKVVPVLVIENEEDVVPLGQTLMKSQLPIAEVTFRTEIAATAIKLLKQNFPTMLVGAGTVLNQKQVEQAKLAGADFVVTPGINIETLTACQAIGLPIIPGVSSASDIELALNHGISTVKFFPAEAAGGTAMLKALLGPYPMLTIMPTGGISKNNICDYLAIPAVVACGASWVAEKSLVTNKQWDEISERIIEVNEVVN